MSAPKTIKVTAGLLRRDNKLLIAQRVEDKHHGKWEFPGGKFEAGETIAQCLQRELREELQIECTVGEIFCRSSCRAGEKIIELITCEIESFYGSPQAHVHKQLKWVKISELSEYEFLDADIEVVKRLLSAL